MTIISLTILADVELRETILKVWPFTAKEKIELLVPTTRGVCVLKRFFLSDGKGNSKILANCTWQFFLHLKYERFLVAN